MCTQIFTHGHVLVNSAQLSSNAPRRRRPTMQDSSGLVSDIRPALTDEEGRRRTSEPSNRCQDQTNYSTPAHHLREQKPPSTTPESPMLRLVAVKNNTHLVYTQTTESYPQCIVKHPTTSQLSFPFTAVVRCRVLLLLALRAHIGPYQTTVALGRRGNQGRSWHYCHLRRSGVVRSEAMLRQPVFVCRSRSHSRS